MKLSLIVTSLLVISSLIFSACGSDDDDNNDTVTPTSETTTPSTGGTDAGEETNTDALKVYTADELKTLVAGKTIYSYGYNYANPYEKNGENRVKLVFSKDGTQADAFDIDSDEFYGSGAITFSNSSIKLINDEINFKYEILSDNEDGIYIQTGSDLYPNIFAYEKQDDKGSSLLKNFAESTVVTEDTILKEQYVVAVQENNGDTYVMECLNATYNDGTYSQKMLTGSGSASYSIAGTHINITMGEESDSFEILGLSSNIMITLIQDEEGHPFTNIGYAEKQDAIDFALTFGKDCSGDFDQLEQL